jgi:hypothetical protein
MYYMILTAIITASSPPILPAIMGSYVSLERCLDDLVAASKYEDFKLAKHPMLGRTAIKIYSEEGVAILFCAKDRRSI